MPDDVLEECIVLLTTEERVGRWVSQRVVVRRVSVDGRVSGDLWVSVDELGGGGGDQSHGGGEQQH